MAAPSLGHYAAPSFVVIGVAADTHRQSSLARSLHSLEPTEYTESFVITSYVRDRGGSMRALRKLAIQIASGACSYRIS